MALEVNLMFAVAYNDSDPTLEGWFEQIATDIIQLNDIEIGSEDGRNVITGAFTFTEVPAEEELLNFQTKFVGHIPEYAVLAHTAFLLLPKVEV